MGSENESKESKKVPGYDQALFYCQSMIDWYETVKFKQRLAYQAAQIAIIVLSGITPILILVGEIPVFWQALPPAVVTILVGLSGIFQWKENYLRFAFTSQALQSEKVRFETRTSSDYHRQLKEVTALERFVTRVDNIVMGEVGEWRVLMQESVSSKSSE